MDKEKLKEFIFSCRGKYISTKETDSIEYKEMVKYCYEHDYFRYNGENSYMISEKGFNLILGKEESPTVQIGHNFNGNIIQSNLLNNSDNSFTKETTTTPIPINNKKMSIAGIIGWIVAFISGLATIWAVLHEMNVTIKF